MKLIIADTIGELVLETEEKKQIIGPNVRMARAINRKL